MEAKYQKTQKQSWALKIQLLQNPVHQNHTGRRVKQGKHLNIFPALLNRLSQNLIELHPNGCQNMMQRRMLELKLFPWIEIRQMTVSIQIFDITGMTICIFGKIMHIMLPRTHASINHIDKLQQKTGSENQKNPFLFIGSILEMSQHTAIVKMLNPRTAISTGEVF